MADPLALLAQGFSELASFEIMGALLLGCFLGTVVGVLPGVGSSGAMVILLPLTFTMNAEAALAMLCAIFYGAMYGGSTSSILMSIPGETMSIVTVVDGYAMTKRGRAGAALAVAAVGSFVAGTLSLVLLMFFTPLLASAAMEFSSSELFFVTLFALVVLSRLGGKSVVITLLMLVLGLMFKTVGIDSMFNIARFTFGSRALYQGFDMMAIAMGLYGLGQVLASMEEGDKEAVQVASVRLREMLPTREEARRAGGAILRGTALGFPLGLVPGAGMMSTFGSYALEKRISKNPDEFGQGAIEGVAGPEAANNASAIADLIPLLSLGLPFDPLTALLLGAFIMQGIQVGPLMMQDRPDVFWALVASMYLGNVVLLILNLPLVSIFVRMLAIPRDILVAVILLMCMMGCYSISNSTFDLLVGVGFAVFGYACRRLNVSLLTLIIPAVIGAMMERNFLQLLNVARGDIGYIWTRPIAAAMMLATILVIVVPAVRSASQAWARRGKAGSEVVENP